jgi:hypothetical protein
VDVEQSMAAEVNENFQQEQICSEGQEITQVITQQEKAILLCSDPQPTHDSVIKTIVKEDADNADFANNLTDFPTNYFHHDYSLLPNFEVAGRHAILDDTLLDMLNIVALQPPDEAVCVEPAPAANTIADQTEVIDAPSQFEFNVDESTAEDCHNAQEKADLEFRSFIDCLIAKVLREDCHIHKKAMTIKHSLEDKYSFEWHVSIYKLCDGADTFHSAKNNDSMWVLDHEDWVVNVFRMK